jgi:hypothetical protein
VTRALDPDSGIVELACHYRTTFPAFTLKLLDFLNKLETDELTPASQYLRSVRHRLQWSHSWRETFLAKERARQVRRAAKPV